MNASIPDVIDRLAGIAPGSRLHDIRAQRPQARENAQLSFLALFKPEVPGDVTLRERYAIAVFVAGVHREPVVGGLYGTGLAGAGGRDVEPALQAEIARGSSQGPYGRFPAGPLSREDKAGPLYRVVEEHRPALGKRLAAALEHAHMLVFHPRDAEPAALQALLDAGWTTTGIVTLSQLVAFLSFQIRIVTGLRALAGT